MTTGLSDAIVVNSLFTRGVFKDVFPRIEKAPDVIYPCVDINPAIEPIPENNPLIEYLKYLSPNIVADHRPRKVILSINRFERKKNIALAIESFASVSDQIRKSRSALLVIAGGHDPRNAENIAYSTELSKLSSSLNLTHITLSPPFSTAPTQSLDVLFLHNIPGWLKSHLLSTSILLVYSPTNEHFGIVPLEAQLHSTPVLATPTGGPLETIEDNLTGFLRPAEQWTSVLESVLLKGVNPKMGIRGRERVVAEFSKEAMAGRLEIECVDVVERTGGVGQGRWLLKWDLWVGWGVVGVLLVMLALQLSS